MAKIKLSCKHCEKAFLVNWNEIIRRRTGIGYKRIEQPSRESLDKLTLDLKCPICSKKASYKRSDEEKR